MSIIGSYESPIALHGCTYWALPDYFRKDRSVSKRVQNWGWAVRYPDGKVIHNYGCATKGEALRTARVIVVRRFGPEAQDGEYYQQQYGAGNVQIADQGVNA